MQLVLFIEEEFNIIVDNTELEPDTFGTIDNMVKLIENKVLMKADT